MIKEHVANYKSDARRKEKAAVVQVLVSKLESEGYRFLHRSTAGIWVEAPPRLVKNKVGHGLRDARIEAGKINGEVTVRPKKARPCSSEKRCRCHLKPVITEDAKTAEGMRGEASDITVVIPTCEEVGCDASLSLDVMHHLIQLKPVIIEETKTAEGMRGEESNNTEVITTGEDIGCDASLSLSAIRHLIQLKPVIIEETKTAEGMRGEESNNTEVITTGEDVGCDASISLSAMHHLIPDSSIPDREQQLLDANVPSNLDNAFDSNSMLHECLSADGLLEDEGLPLLENEIEQCFDEHWGCGGLLDKIAEQWPLETPSAFEMELGLEDLELNWDDKNEAVVLPGVSTCQGATHTAQVVDSLDVALTIYTAFYKNSSLSFEDCITDDPYEPLGYDVEDAHSLCRWFTHLS
jgi:hypothetical protein